MSRQTELLEKAAEALDDMRDPFEHAFLIENAVRSDEIFTLSEQMALGARLLLVVLEQAKQGGIYAQNSGMLLAQATMRSVKS